MASPAPPPTTTTTTLHVLPSTPPSATVVDAAIACAPGAAPSIEVSTIYDFEDAPVLPLPYGPHIADMPPFDVPRSRASVRAAVASVSPALLACYRWARQPAPDLTGDVVLALPVDHWGAIGEVRVEEAPGALAELAACAAEAVRGGALAMPSAQDALAHVRVRFVADPGATVPRVRPRRPRAPTPASSRLCGTCFRIQQGVQSVELTDPIPELIVRERAPLPPSAVPHIVTGTMDDGYRARSVEHMRRMIDANAGHYRACYLEALVRDPTLAGRVVVSARFAPGGLVTGAGLASVDASANDPALLACLLDAFREVSLHPLYDSLDFVVSWPFLLRPLDAPLTTPRDEATLDELAANADALLAEQNGEPAYARYETVLAAAPDDARACAWERDALESARLVAPWGDPRTRHAAERLADRLASGASCDGAVRALEEEARGAWPDAEVPFMDPWVDEAVIAHYGWLATHEPPVPGLDEIVQRYHAARIAIGAEVGPVAEPDEDARAD